MHLIQGKLAGKEIPTALPQSLIPPSMRGTLGAAPSQPSQPAVPEAIKDLLWDDSPPPSATAPAPPSIFQPQSTGSILQPQGTGSVMQAQTTGSLSGRPTPTMSPPPRAQYSAVSDPFASSPFGASASAFIMFTCSAAVIFRPSLQLSQVPPKISLVMTMSRMLPPLPSKISPLKSATLRTNSLLPIAR